jgi:methylase of polypeptide subunit release factors
MNAIESRRTGILRLRNLQEVTEAKGEEMAAERGRFERLADPAAAPKAFTGFNLFPTPPALAERVVELAEISGRMTVLEPSAGTGNLIRAVLAAAPDARLTAVEIEWNLAFHLQGQFGTVDVRNEDFLKANPGKFDRIVMNPPFQRGTDVKHVRHAATMLAPGGRLVSIVAAGPWQRKQLGPIATQWIDLPAGSFRSEGTNVAAAIAVIDAA